MQEEESARVRRELAESAQSAQEAYKTVERAAETPTAANILAARDMEEHIRKILDRWNADSKSKVKPAQLWQRLQDPDKFREAYREAAAPAAQALPPPPTLCSTLLHIPD